MTIKEINRLFPFRKLFNMLLGLSLTVQFVIILYNHFSGYFVLESTTHFFGRWFFGTLLSLAGAFLMAYPDLFFIQILNRKLPWSKRLFQHVVLQFIFTLVVGTFAALLVTLTSHFMGRYIDELGSVIFYNALIGSVINLLLMVLLEAWLHFNESSLSKEKAEKLEKELSQIKFEVLKNQINPHFMFNSLNVLSELIDTSVDDAQRFIDEFSAIYRYVLETIEKPVVTLDEELGFVRSYFFLQQKRYGQSLKLNIDVPAEMLKLFLPPLSLQVVLENAIKHNVVNESSPLKIDISEEEGWLVVENNIQPKVSAVKSTGVGQENMVKRYAMIGTKIPKFVVKTSHYSVKLPLIKQ
jgi:sensor histidine kinase YesM